MTDTRLVALRGAITCDEDTTEQIHERTQRVLTAMLERNQVDHDDIVSIIFTATDDLHSDFPATGARALGLGDIPLLCARELDISGAVERCVRILVHCYSGLPRSELHHVYLEGARALRDDLPE